MSSFTKIPLKCKWIRDPTTKPFGPKSTRTQNRQARKGINSAASATWQARKWICRLSSSPFFGFVLKGKKKAAPAPWNALRVFVEIDSCRFGYDPHGSLPGVKDRVEGTRMELHWPESYINCVPFTVFFPNVRVFRASLRASWTNSYLPSYSILTRLSIGMRWPL